MRTLLRGAFLTGTALAIALAIPGMANAALPSPSPSCVATKTVTTHLVSRPDSGNNGDWAADTFTRKVVICEQLMSTVGAKTVVSLSHYHAVVHDQGSFVTIQSKSPQAGVKLLAGTKGAMTGGFTADFTAESGFKNFKGYWDKGTIVGNPPGSPTTPLWVQTVWGGTDFKGSSLNDDWSWTYTTCSEKWRDWYKTSGNQPSDGDITGKVCPSKSPAPSPSPVVTSTSTPKPPASSSPSSSPAAGGSLPVTGAPIALIAGIGGVLLLGGGGAWYATRRRKTVFKA